MTLSDVFDHKISKIRFSHNMDTESGMQKFQSQLKLSNGKHILIPRHPDKNDDLLALYEKNKSTSFLKAKRCGLASRVIFKNKQIVDIHFKYLNNEFCEGTNGIIELENGMYVTENSSGPIGLTDIDLVLMNRQQFLDSIDEDIELKSFRKDIVKG